MSLAGELGVLASDDIPINASISGMEWRYDKAAIGADDDRARAKKNEIRQNCEVRMSTIGMQIYELDEPCTCTD
jgi:hypothetical protein